VAALSTLVFKVADLKQKTLWRMDWLRVTPGVLALALGGALLLAALVHTAVRYFGRAAALLPVELIRGPVLSGALAEATPAAGDPLRDPLYEAKSGYLYLIQHDIDMVLKDLHDAGYDLVVFIDDLDRCSARTTAEVFEAVNLFLSGTTNLDAKFVIGLDPAVVAAHLDKVYEDLADPSLVLHGDDPSPGWAFLRKVVQLPVRVPHIPDESVEHFVAAVLNVPETELQAAATASSTTAAAPARPADPIVPPSPAQAVPAAVQQRRARTGPVERQPEVLDIIRRRLAAQPQRSAREAKRLLNVWQLYYRLLDRTAPLWDDDALVVRACHLVILAEIVTRWPALQRRLHHAIDGKRGLQILAEAASDDARWQAALTTVGLNSPEEETNEEEEKEERPPSTHEQALSNLRTLLKEYDGCAVADLAAQLL
jgi:KAP family P-loop domain